MPASFLHGVEIIETTSGPLPITVVKSAVIGLIGTAPQWAVPSSNPVQPPAPNTPTLVSSLRDASQFGPEVQGYSIPYALNAMLEQGAGQAIVINVLNPNTHNTSVAATAFSFPASGPQVINLGHMGICKSGAPSAPVVTASSGTPVYVENTDYTVDYINGLITAKSGGTITEGEAVKIAFNYIDPSKVMDTDIIGAFTAGAYTGIQALKTTYNSMGFWAKILIAPFFSQDQTVAAALTSMANSLRGMALIDAAAQTQIATAISNRGLSTTPFGTSSNRAILCFPQQYMTDTGIVPTGLTLDVNGNPVVTYANNPTAEFPLSIFEAGAMANSDLTRGYWWSPSNQQLIGPAGADISMYASYMDPNSDTNALNAAGICTVFNAFGTGLRTWGNRSAAYPTSTAPDNFINIRRTMDVLEESLQMASLQYLDNPLNMATITAVLASTNAFIRTLIQRGALVAGSVTFDPGNNPPSQLAAGQAVFSVDVMPPPPMERITYQTTIDINLLKALTGSNPVA